MINKKCKHRITGHIGIIKNELDDSYGIYWLNNSDGSDQIKRLGAQYYWQNKEDIELLKQLEDEKDNPNT